MARNKAIQEDIDGSDLVNYPDKRIRDDDGSGNGTPVSESVYGDIHEFFAKMMREAGLIYNNTPDNVDNGYQLYDAMLLLANKNDYVTSLVQASVNTLQVSFPLNAFKVDECLFVRATINSSIPPNPTAFIKIKGSDRVVKNCLIPGSGFKIGDLVRITNLNTYIEVVGLYDSVNVPNLEKRLSDLESVFAPIEKKLAVFEAGGGMVLWNKPASDIPAGWAEVVDWRGRIPAGFLAGDAIFGVTGVVGGQGGSPTKTLSISEMPKHKHLNGMSDDITGAFVYGGSTSGMPGLATTDIDTGGSTRAYQGFTSEEGNSSPFNIMNPYRTVLFIEYVG